MENLPRLLSGVRRLKAKEAPAQDAPVSAAAPAGDNAALTRLIGHTKTQVECTLEAVAEEREELAKYHATVTQMLSDRGRMESELIEKNQEIARLSSQLQNWEKAAISYFDTIHRTLSFPDLSEAERAGAEREYKDFARTVIDLGLEPIRPATGDAFLDSHFQAVGTEHSDAPDGAVARCVSWGFRNGARVIRRAEVYVSKSGQKGK